MRTQRLSANVNLVAIPQVDIGALPLYLPEPDGINNGGYSVPSKYKGDWRKSFTQPRPAYSPIDLLVAGIEAVNSEKKVSSLVGFFDSYRDRTILSTYYVHIIIKMDVIKTITIAEAITLGKENRSFELVMIKNAPLTWKWV